MRIDYEKRNNIILPKQIVYKYVVEKKSPVAIAKETNHSQLAVDRYLKDFQRINYLANENKDIQTIHQLTKIAKPVITQYLQIIEQYVKEPKNNISKICNVI